MYKHLHKLRKVHARYANWLYSRTNKSPNGEGPGLVIWLLSILATPVLGVLAATISLWFIPFAVLSAFSVWYTMHFSFKKVKL